MTQAADADIEWLEGSQSDYTERELALMDRARQEGNEAGYRKGFFDGQLKGGVQAIKAITGLNTLFNDARFAECLETLRYFIKPPEASDGA